MKVIVLLVCLAAFVAAKDKIIKKDGKECICRPKECGDDITCQEHHCLCMMRNVKALENDKSDKYPKSWVMAYRKMVQKHCRCMKNCEKKFSEDDMAQCSERTWDRFTCNFKEMASEILSKCSEGQAEKYFGDIGKINANCIKIDCQPQCIGNAGCDPLLRDADIGCIKEAMKQAKSELPDHDCIDDLENLERILIQHANGIAACRKNHKSPIACHNCEDQLRSRTAVAIAAAKSSFYTSHGHCTGGNIWYNVISKITICEIKAEK